MMLAESAKIRSEDPYVKVGSVAFRADWSVIGVGYNGLPSGVTVEPGFWEDRDGRRPFMIHAEVNALRYARAGEPKFIVSTHIPCAACLSVLGSYRVDEVYWRNELGSAYDMDTIREVAALNNIKLTRKGYV
jgi:dCMP deaminase